MNHYRKLLHFRTREQTEIVNITPLIEQTLAESRIQEGFALLFPLHTSSAVYLSDSDPSLTRDFADLLDALVPASRQYRHDRTDHKQNAAGHLKAILSGHSVPPPVPAARLDLGLYQTLYYFEFDGQRPKEVLVKIIGE
jgi:secondary thiamine-phosphate synthase enzyme